LIVSRRWRGSEFLKTRIIPERIGHCSPSPGCSNRCTSNYNPAPQHDLWKHFVDLAYWNVELSN